MHFIESLASGALPKAWAKFTIVLLLIACAATVALTFLLPLPSATDLFAWLGGANVLFALTLATYLVLMVLYTVRLKHVVLIDVSAANCLPRAPAASVAIVNQS